MALPLLHRNREPERAEASKALSQPFDPRRELEELRERLDRMTQSLWEPAEGLLEAGLGWSPPVDVEEADDAWIVEAELPGIKEKDIVLELHGSELSIGGDIEERKRTGILRRRTRRVGRFDYRVSLPGVSDTEDVQATLEHGVLTVRVPKPEHAKRRRIAISSAAR